MQGVDHRDYRIKNSNRFVLVQAFQLNNVLLQVEKVIAVGVVLVGSEAVEN